MAFFKKSKPSVPDTLQDRPLPPAPIAPDDVCRGKCQQTLLWERYLFEDHTRKQLASWAQRLRFFRFCRAYGGHANDGDTLKAVLRLEDERSLLRTCASLAIPLLPMPPEAELAHLPPGERPSSSRVLPGWQQPKHVVLAGHRVFCWFSAYLAKDDIGNLTGASQPALELSIAEPSDLWSVTEVAVLAAQAVEQILEPLAAQVLDPPQDDRNCICPKHHPELFGLAGRATARWPFGASAPR